MAEKQDGCVAPAGGVIEQENEQTQTTKNETRQEVAMAVQPGKPAPDFEASAFVDGGFKNVKLSDYEGKWRIVCFYPGDFTFV